MSLIEYVDNFEEVDIVMANRFRGLLIDGKEVPVIYYSPDVDLHDLEMPSIVIYRNEPFPDNSRWKHDEVRDNFEYNADGEVTKMSIRKPPEPWSILYSVRTIYKYQQDGVKLNRHMFRTFPRGSFVSIKGINYDVNFVRATLTGSGYKDFGRTEDGEKQLGETYSYRVNILLDVYDREDVKTVQEVNVKTSQK
jgi:hypothetical protein